MSNFFRNITSRRGIGLLIPATTVVVAVMVHGDREENDVRDNNDRNTSTTKIYSSVRNSTSSWMNYLKSPTYYDYNNTNHFSSKTYCDAANAAAVSRISPKLVETDKDNHTTTPIQIRPGGQMLQQQPSTGVHENEQKEQKEEEVYYHNLFPLRQLFVPALEYPLWDENWDERQSHPPNTSTDGNDDMGQQQQQQQQHKNYIRQLRKNGVTRHIILVRHGQYDETHKVCRSTTCQ